ncbi:MAG TPA: SAF domain-containing protein, partial [Phenylobacterium sp.]|nr:SAF domain-containing protein [Phenylobacterium sp.]
MGAVRIAIIATAALAAIVLAFVVRGMVAPKRPESPAPAAAAAPPPRPMAQVLVAKRDLPVGARLAALDMTWQAWPVDALNPNFITDGAAAAPVDPGAKQVAQDTAR